MVRVGAVLLLISGALGARVKHQLDALGSTKQHPVPTPPGYKWDWDMMYNCYAGSHHLSKTPPGYKLNDGKCPGEPLLNWSDGSSSLFGTANMTEPVDCAKECNKYEECAGFYSVAGQCSHWHRGELQDLPMETAPGHECYVKWEVRNLDGVTAKVKNEPAPPEPVPEPPKGLPQVSDCLCVWDVDRTLTAKQGRTNCPNTKEYPAIPDYGYNGGSLILSELALQMNQTFCGKCYFGIVSAGTASGPTSENRRLLDSLVDPKYNIGGWVDACPTPVWGSKVMCCGEGTAKTQAVRDIVTWMGQKGIKIPDEKVHFFDDKANNIEAFTNTRFNAHMVSCGSRDGARGGCGGVISEAMDIKGSHVC